MDRTLASQRGFTLVELMITVVIIGIIIAIAMGNYRSISQTNSLSRDLNSMASFLQNKRMTAFTQKEKGGITTITIQPRNSAGVAVAANAPFQRLTTTPDYGMVVTENFFLSSVATFTINSRGIFSTTGSIRISGSNYGAPRDCIVIANTRVRIGVWNSATTTCDPE